MNNHQMQIISEHYLTSPNLSLIDTHTHFDEAVFDHDRIQQAKQAWQQGVRHLVLVGYVASFFRRLFTTQSQINQENNVPISHVAIGLHPFYIEQHGDTDLYMMEDLLQQEKHQLSKQIVAIGEIGLDTFTPQMKQEEIYKKQQRFFLSQLDMAVQYQKPVLLHIRKAHADCLRLLKSHAFIKQDLYGIAHSFSGGEQEAKAFVKLGFKLGITGQITNPNAKKLRRAVCAVVETYGLGCLVLETDCPDMLPIMCQSYSDDIDDLNPLKQRNTPANLGYVLLSLSELLGVDIESLATQLWKNSCQVLPCFKIS